MRTIILAIACLATIGSAHANISCGASSGRIMQTHGYLNMGATLPPRIEELEAKPPRIVVRKKITDIKVKPWNPCAPQPPAPPDRRKLMSSVLMLAIGSASTEQRPPRAEWRVKKVPVEDIIIRRGWEGGQPRWISSSVGVSIGPRCCRACCNSAATIASRCLSRSTASPQSRHAAVNDTDETEQHVDQDQHADHDHDRADHLAIRIGDDGQGVQDVEQQADDDTDHD